MYVFTFLLYERCKGDIMQNGCPSCGRLLEGYFEKCPHCGYDLTGLHKIVDKYEEERQANIPRYAGFIQRTVANQLDILFIILIFTILLFIMCKLFNFNFWSMFSLSFWHNHFSLLFVMVFCIVIFYFFYCVFCQYSKNLATYGERVVGIKVVDAEGLPLNYLEVFKHNLFRIFNILTFGIGYFIIIFNKQKQALSDILSHTYVCNVETNDNELYYANAFSRFIAYIIDCVLIYLFCYGVQLLFPMLFATPYNFGEISNILYLIVFILFFIILLFYFPFMESRYGASFGKIIMKIKVSDYNGDNIGFWHSFFRMIFISFEFTIFVFGTLICFTSPKKQTLKDMLTKTVVIKK